MRTALPLDVLTETTGADAAAVVRLKAELFDAVAKVAAKDDEITAINRLHASELAAVHAHSLDGDAFDEAVASRTALIGAARSILGAEFDPNGKSDMAIRRLAARQQLGEALLTGKDDTYVKIVFDTLVASMVKTNCAQTPNSAQTSISGGILHSDVVAAYSAQIGTHHNADNAAHGHADIKHAIRLGFEWIQHGIQRQDRQQSKF